MSANKDSKFDSTSKKLVDPNINTLNSDPSSDHLAVESAIISITASKSSSELKYLKYKKKYLELK
jgi:hypothetical protein